MCFNIGLIIFEIAMSEEEDKEEKKENDLFDKFYENRWMWIGLMLVVTVVLELQFGVVN